MIRQETKLSDINNADTIAVSSMTRQAAAIQRREISSRELLSLYVDRIARLDKEINSVITLEIEQAATMASEMDYETARGYSRGPLHGLPITVKDALETKGIRSTGGARELAEHIPDYDAAAVERLKQAGAIVFGKTNVPRWSDDVQTYNDLFGTTNNPWDTNFTPGGSSGGPAAAVACGFTSFDLGTDIGGSIRTPAHMCGVYGLRPSYGLVPQQGYLSGTRPNLQPLDVNVVGPIARSADDLAVLIDTLAGPEPTPATAWTLRLPREAPERLSDYRIGVWLDDPFCRVELEQHQSIENLVAELANYGTTVREEHPSVDFEAIHAAYFSLLMSANGLNEPMTGESDQTMAHRKWLQIDDLRVRQRMVWQRWFEQGFDALICPVLATTAFRHDQAGDYTTRLVTVNGKQRTHADIARWAGLVGALGLPCAVAPIGQTDAGLPIGVQVITPFLHDHRAIQLARLVGHVGGGYKTPPGYGTAGSATCSSPRSSGG